MSPGSSCWFWIIPWSTVKECNRRTASSGNLSFVIFIFIILILSQVCLKSLLNGKSQGKNGTGRLIAKCVSCWEKNKISHRTKIETIKKRMSFTTLPLYTDDVKDRKFLCKVTEGYDDGETYETNEVNN